MRCQYDEYTAASVSLARLTVHCRHYSSRIL